MNDVVIVSAVRTAVGDFLGALKDLSCIDLGAMVLKAAMEKAKVDPTLIEEVVCGNPDMAGAGPNPGRQVAVRAGCPWETFACTVNQQCVSSMRAAEILTQEVILGKMRVRGGCRLRKHVECPLSAHGGAQRTQNGSSEAYRPFVQRRHGRCVL